MWVYLEVAALSILATTLTLQVTKIPAVVMVVAATVVSVIPQIADFIDLGYLDKFWPIALVVSWFYAAIVSLAFLWLGRWRKWRLFIVQNREG